MSDYDPIARRIREAEKREMKERPEQPKHRWLKCQCSKCGYRIFYEPKKDWDGELRCLSVVKSLLYKD